MKPIKIITVLFVIAFILIIFFADNGSMPHFIAVLYAFPNGDKVGHFFLMGLLSFLINLSISCHTIKIASVRILSGSLVVAVLITLEEISQLFFPERTCSWLDLAASYLGILVFSYLSILVNRKIRNAP